jgi:hypothetical protein
VKYVHKANAAFFDGSHIALACEKCHGPEGPKLVYDRTRAANGSLPRLTAVSSRGTPRMVDADQSPVPRPRGGTRAGQAVEPAVARWRFKTVTTACASCHQDPHLGQVGAACERCHAVAGARFALVGFSHQAAYPLTGRHERLECIKCHKAETAQFPAARGTAVRLTGIEKTCQTCHADVHQGQVGSTCETCHDTATFRIESYTHKNRALTDFFVGQHLEARCQQCHPPVAVRGTSGVSQVVQYRVDARCTTCHTDVHRGQLGDRCLDCHRLKAATRSSGVRL